MGMAEGDGQRVRGIGAGELHRTELELHHVLDLGLFGMADADHHLLHRIGRVFRHREPGLGRHEQGDGAGLAELEGAGGVLVDEGLLDGSGFRGMGVKDCGELGVEAQKARGEILALRGADAIGHMGERTARDIHDSPTRPAQTRIDPDDAHLLPSFLLLDDAIPRGLGCRQVQHGPCEQNANSLARIA